MCRKACSMSKMPSRTIWPWSISCRGTVEVMEFLGEAAVISTSEIEMESGGNAQHGKLARPTMITAIFLILPRELEINNSNGRSSGLRLQKCVFPTIKPVTCCTSIIPNTAAGLSETLTRFPFHPPNGEPVASAKIMKTFEYPSPSLCYSKINNIRTNKMERC